MKKMKTLRLLILAAATCLIPASAVAGNLGRVQARLIKRPDQGRTWDSIKRRPKRVFESSLIADAHTRGLSTDRFLAQQLDQECQAGGYDSVVFSSIIKREQLGGSITIDGIPYPAQPRRKYIWRRVDGPVEITQEKFAQNNAKDRNDPSFNRYFEENNDTEPHIIVSDMKCMKGTDPTRGSIKPLLFVDPDKELANIGSSNVMGRDVFMDSSFAFSGGFSGGYPCGFSSGFSSGYSGGSPCGFSSFNSGYGYGASESFSPCNGIESYSQGAFMPCGYAYQENYLPRESYIPRGGCNSYDGYQPLPQDNFSFYESQIPSGGYGFHQAQIPQARREFYSRPRVSIVAPIEHRAPIDYRAPRIAMPAPRQEFSYQMNPCIEQGMRRGYNANIGMPMSYHRCGSSGGAGMNQFIQTMDMTQTAEFLNQLAVRVDAYSNQLNDLNANAEDFKNELARLQERTGAFQGAISQMQSHNHDFRNGLSDFSNQARAINTRTNVRKTTSVISIGAPPEIKDNAELPAAPAVEAGSTGAGANPNASVITIPAPAPAVIH